MDKWCGRALALAVALCISACAFSDEGATDYRKAQPTRQSDRQNIDGGPDRKATPEKVSPTDDTPVIKTLLIKKDASIPDATIRKGDKVTVRLRDGLLTDCVEFLRNPIRGFRKNCEIAVVFKAFELGGGRDFKFGKDRDSDGRVVYYSNDVEPGQHFNLHNMPVYGPLDYTGRPFALDIAILEIDAEDAQAEALLKTLASIGSKAFPPAAPVLAVLDQLGGALVKGGTDDTEFRYSMVLDPEDGFSGMAYPVLEAGTYALIRSDNRQATIDWSKIGLDDNTGRLLKLEKGKPAGWYRDNTYITVQINRNAGKDGVQLDQNTYGAFREALENDATEQAAALQTALIPALTSAAVDRVQIRSFSKARAWLEAVLGATMKADLTSEIRLAAFHLHELLTLGIGQHQFPAGQTQKSCGDRLAAKQKPPAGAAPAVILPPETDLSATQIDYLLDRLSRKAEPKDAADLALFTCSETGGFASSTFDAFMDKLFP